MAIKLEILMGQDNAFNNVDCLNYNLGYFLVHAHDYKLVECTFKPFFMSISRKILAYLLQSLLPEMPVWAL